MSGPGVAAPAAGTTQMAAGDLAAARAWAGQAVAVLVKDWRAELRTRHALHTLLLFAVTTLITVSMALGPAGVDPSMRSSVLPAMLWVILLFAASAGLPRGFDAWLSRGLAREPSARFQTAGELADALDAVAHGAGLAVTGTSGVRTTAEVPTLLQTAGAANAPTET